jgi:hypothetical protein
MTVDGRTASQKGHTVSEFIIAVTVKPGAYPHALTNEKCMVFD